MRSPTGAWRRGVRVLSARGGENECQSMSEPGAERQHCTSNTWFPPLSKSLPIVSTLPLNEDSFLSDTCNWYNSQHTTRPGNCVSRAATVLSSRCDSTLPLMLRVDLRSPVSKSFGCGDKRTAKPSKGFFLNNVSALNVLASNVSVKKFSFIWPRVRFNAP